MKKNQLGSALIQKRGIPFFWTGKGEGDVLMEILPIHP